MGWHEIRQKLASSNISFSWMFAAMIVVFLISRLLWLNCFPPFIDEALHIGLAMVFRLGNFSAGFLEGKWLTTTIFATFLSLPGESLCNIRLVSVICGLLSMIGLFFIGKRLFTIRIGFLASFLYLTIPYALFYDRLALADGILVTFGIWVVYVTIKVISSDNGRLSVLLATLLTLSLFIKAPAMVFIMIPPLAILILIPSNQWLNGAKKVFPAILGSLIVLITLMIAGYGTENFRGKYSIDLSQSLIDLFMVNQMLLLDWGWHMLTPVLAIVSLFALGWSLIIDRSRPILFLISLLLLAIFPYLIIATTFYPRYVLFALAPICLLLSCFISRMADSLKILISERKRYYFLTSIIGMLIFGWPLYLDFQIIQAPEKAALPTAIRWQYFEGWPSGYGVVELTEYLLTAAMETELDQIIVARPFMGGHVYGSWLDLSLNHSENILLEVIGSDSDVALAKIAKWLNSGQRLVLVADTTNPTGMATIEQIAHHLELELIWAYHKPACDQGFVIWEVHRIL